jgi:nucleoside-diphosphate-sugar epimerase
MAKTISILGCGWLGTALGRKLMSQGYVVKGSAATSESYNRLEFTGIQTYHIRIEPDRMIIDYNSFFNTDVLICSIPPRRTENIVEEFPKQVKQIAREVQKMNISKVIFISSTSVYESKNCLVFEGQEGNPEKASGRALLKAENLLLNLPGVQSTIVRFGGLIGENRNPARFMAGKRKVTANSPVNLIHRDDCVAILSLLIENEIWGEVFNACSPEHPTKEEFYTRAAKISGLPVPEFSEGTEDYKIVSSDKLIQKLGYTFKYPSPMDYLKELEEWTYRI